MQVVQGAGVVGEQPVLEPGDAFEYTSGTPLDTSSGFMMGTYHMVATETGEPLFNPTGVDIPYSGGLVVSLDSPSTAIVAPLGTNTGNGTFGAIAVAAPALTGVYVVNLESATGFTVEGGNGQEIGHGVAGTPFSAGGIGFTLTAGGTAFAAGDSFKITVAPGDGGYLPYTGVAPAAALLFNRVLVPAGGSRKVTVVTRLAEVNGAEIQWDPAVTGSGSVATLQATALAQLAAAGIVARPIAPSAG